MSRRLEHVEAAADECLHLGADFQYQVKSKNIVGRIGYNGQTRKLFMSCTPSDYKASLNIRKNIREYIRQMKA